MDVIELLSAVVALLGAVLALVTAVIQARATRQVQERETGRPKGIDGARETGQEEQSSDS
ncbi:hypothetical protein ACH470_23545 [Streptomyces bottropensis]|uniref:hypothetical protein n=1 Tax=Streptomyces bottropensis TaxID=42235 RepID=UPI0037B17038